ncbi:UPF0489 family protein [Cyanobium sp. Candia 9D4]|uniref:UPF0489 family protein n=1 Tax=Cyanobium sp. Candia 9D4 TaxID=2823707 RepID=UPI0020CBD1D9|nr:UPF0489 family protein [Cyanobium sp. Candia 9D4]MCP9933378.1 UPF0489 family protein [Cyanobium sp. Candia 9D4]
MTPSHILDIDIDLFVNKPAYWCEAGERLSSDEYRTWSETEIRSFLEGACGLRKTNQIPGRIVEHHHEVFHIWRKLVESRKVETPFEVVHPDSHADLGFGDPGWVYLMGELLHLPIGERTNPKVGWEYMNAGNYLAFAAACGWLSRLTYVHHPQGGNDLMHYHFRDFDVASNEIELKRCPLERLRRLLVSEPSYLNFGVEQRGPTLPFQKISCLDYSCEEPFDYVFFARSPEFTPIESDLLLPIFQEYIQII